MTGAPFTWLPFDLHDEVIPNPRRSPNAWLMGPEPDGRWKLDGWPDGQGTTYIRPGDLVRFSWHQRRGSVEVRVSQERETEVVGMRPSGNCFTIDGEIDTLMDDFDACVEAGVEHLFASDLPTTFEVEGYFWSDEIMFRLDVTKHSAALVPCNPKDVRLPSPAPQDRLPIDTWLLDDTGAPRCRLNDNIFLGVLLDESTFVDWRGEPIKNGEPVPAWLRDFIVYALDGLTSEAA